MAANRDWLVIAGAAIFQASSRSSWTTMLTYAERGTSHQADGTTRHRLGRCAGSSAGHANRRRRGVRGGPVTLSPTNHVPGRTLAQLQPRAHRDLSRTPERWSTSLGALYPPAISATLRGMADQALKTYGAHARGVRGTIHYTVHAERVDSDRAFLRSFVAATNAR